MIAAHFVQKFHQRYCIKPLAIHRDRNAALESDAHSLGAVGSLLR